MLCENTKIDIRSSVNAQFPPGWRNIIEELINSIKNYPISITRIYDTYSVLDVKFDIEKPTKEVHVWRAIEKARTDSAITCGMCGEEMGFRKRMNPLEMLCDSCRKSAGNTGKTQTWLDRF